MSSTEGILSTPVESKELRKFALVVGAALVLVALAPLRHALPPRLWALAISGALGLAALIHIRLLAMPYRIWTLIGHALGAVNSRIILSLLYFAVVTPLALVLRLLDHRELDLNLLPQAESYRKLSKAREVTHLERPY